MIFFFKISNVFSICGDFTFVPKEERWRPHFDAMLIRSVYHRSYIAWLRMKGGSMCKSAPVPEYGTGVLSLVSQLRRNYRGTVDGMVLRQMVQRLEKVTAEYPIRSCQT